MVAIGDAVTGGWIIGPPGLLFLEYILIGRSAKSLPSVEAFKYTQDLAAKFWLAAVSILIFVFTGKIPGQGG
jgi:hypothetical protein